MKLPLALTLLILIQTTLANEHEHFHENRSHPTALSKYATRYRSYPCPREQHIIPCSCSYKDEVLVIDCSLARSSTSLQETWEEYFPVKEFRMFKIKDNYNIRHLNHSHDIRFEKIYIRNSTLEKVSFNFFNSSTNHLNEVYIRHTQLTTFPLSHLNSFCKLESLTILESRLTAIGRLRSESLVNIDFSYNDISFIDSDTFTDVPHLGRLKMYGNYITTLKTHLLPISSYIRLVSFRSNPISTIEQEAFYYGSPDIASFGLSSLDFSHCLLTRLDQGVVPLTSRTTLVDLEGNDISFISPGAFSILSEPELNSVIISLATNQLRIIDEEVFGDIMKYIRRLDLQDNPLACGCDIAWILRDGSIMEKIDFLSSCADDTNCP